MSKKVQFRTIQSYDCVFGGEGWRATSNGERVNIQSQSDSSTTWVTRRCMTAEAFEDYAEKVGMSDPYNQNITHLASLANEDH